MTTLPPYSRQPITLPDGTPVLFWSGPTAPTRPQRCDCGRPVPASSSCGCCCAEHDHPYPTTARFDERYDPSPEPRAHRKAHLVSNDPDLLDVWIECDLCDGEGTLLGDDNIDVLCSECDGDGGWER